MWLIDLIGGIFELWTSWRLYLCLAITFGIAAFLHFVFPDQVWPWFISVPIVTFGFSFGFWWQIRADRV